MNLALFIFIVGANIDMNHNDYLIRRSGKETEQVGGKALRLYQYRC